MLLGVSVLGLVAIAIAQTLSSSVAVSVSAVLAITAVGIGIVGLIWALSTLSLFLTLSPGRSTMTAGLLRVEQGVLTLRTTTTPMKRVQLCRLRCGPVGQLMNWINVEYSSADATIGTGQQPRQVLALAVGIDQALDVIDFESGPVAIRQPQPTELAHVERLVACDKFVLDRWRLSAARSIGGDNRSHLISVIEGRVTVQNDHAAQPLRKGEAILLPAACGSTLLSPHGDATLLVASLP